MNQNTLKVQLVIWILENTDLDDIDWLMSQQVETLIKWKQNALNK